MYETRFANRPGERGQTFRTTMRPAMTCLTLASAAAFTLPYLLPAAALDAALAAAGLPAGEAARLLAFAYLPAALGAAATGLRLRLDGAGAPQSLVAAGLVALAGALCLLAGRLPTGGAAAHLVGASATGLLVLSLHGLGLCALCVPDEPSALPAAPAAGAEIHPLPAGRPRPTVQAPDDPATGDRASGIALAA